MRLTRTPLLGLICLALVSCAVITPAPVMEAQKVLVNGQPLSALLPAAVSETLPIRPIETHLLPTSLSYWTAGDQNGDGILDQGEVTVLWLRAIPGYQDAQVSPPAFQLSADDRARLRGLFSNSAQGQETLTRLLDFFDKLKDYSGAKAGLILGLGLGGS